MPHWDRRRRASSGRLRGDGGELSLSLDVVFGLLADCRRRYVLYELREECYLELEELARRVAARECGVDPDEVPDDAVSDVEVSLYHSEIPRLTEHSVIEFDARQQDVYRAVLFDVLEKYLAIAESDEETRK